MAIADLEIFNDELYTARRELLDYNVNIMNEQTRGGLVLSSGSLQGDFATEAFWRRITGGLVARRNPYSDEALSTLQLTQDTWTKVKVGSGSLPVNLEPSMFKWIQESPDAAAAMVMKQIVEDDVVDRVKTAINVFVASVGQHAALTHDATDGTLTLDDLAAASSKLGDRFSAIRCWVMHSKVWFDTYRLNLANASNLFTIGDVKVFQDPLGTPIVITDNDALVYLDGEATRYRTLGLQAGGVTIESNGDFLANTVTTNGRTNIGRTMQSEWTYNVGVRGCAWNTSAGGAAPNDAALVTTTNWVKVATSNKDLPGVLIKSR